MGGIEGIEGSAVAHRQAGHQLVRRPVGPDPQTTAVSAAIAVEVIHGAEVCVRVVVAPHRLARLAEHRPAALAVERHPGRIETHALQVGSGVAGDGGDQGSEGGIAAQPPHAVEVARPGAGGIGVGSDASPQLLERL